MSNSPQVVPLPSAAQIRMERATMAAIQGLANWSVTRIIGPAEAGDAQCLKHDLIALSEIVDDLVKAFGDYANSTVGLTAKDLEYFHDQLRNAIDGNATHVFDTVAEQLRELREGSEDQRHDFRRGLLTAAE